MLTANPLHAASLDDAVVTGTSDFCPVITPITFRFIQWIGTRPEAISTDVLRIAPAAGGRILGLVWTGSSSAIAWVARRVPPRIIAALPAGAGVTDFVAGQDRIFVLLHHPLTNTDSIKVFDYSGNAIATHEIGTGHAFDLAADQCTLYVDRNGRLELFDACTGTFTGEVPVNLPDFSILPDGGFLVESGSLLFRYSAAGALVRTYQTPFFNIQAFGLARHGQAVWIAQGDETCEGGSALLIDLVTGEALADGTTQIETPTSIVAAQPWTAALGHATGADIPALPPAALTALATLLAIAAAAKLR